MDKEIKKLIEEFPDNEEQRELFESFVEIAIEKGMENYVIYASGDIVFGVMVFGKDKIDNEKKLEIISDFIKVIKEKNSSEEFFDYLYETYLSKIQIPTVLVDGLDEEEAMERYGHSSKEMRKRLERILKEASMTKEHIEEVCDISSAYDCFFDGNGELSDEGKDIIDTFKDRFGDRKREGVFMKLLYKIREESFN